MLLSAVGMGALVFALIESECYGWWRQESGALSPVSFVLVAGLVLLLGFVQLERSRAAAGKDVLVDLGLLRIRSFRNGAIAALIVSFGEFGLLFTLPLAQLGRATHDNLMALGMPSAASDGIVTAVRESAGIAIAGLQAQPGQAAVARAASEAMIEASRWTTGLAAVALLIGLAATIALPRNAGHTGDEPAAVEER
ncbi:hypothetical protein ACQP1U_01430 [Actinomycetota bacterium]